MARSFDVLYRFLAKDSFSGVSKKVRGENKKLNTGFGKLRNSLKKTGFSFIKLKSKLRKLGRGFKKLQTEVRQSGTQVSKFSTGMKQLAAAAIAFIGIKKMIDTASQFEDALADLSAITGATGKDLDMLKQKTFEMAKASITGQADVATAIKLVASAKPELLKNLPLLTKTTEAVLLLKNTGIDLEASVAATVGGLNAFGEGAEFAARNVNILAAGSKFGSSEVRETAEALKLAGPGAKAAGLTFLDLNVAIQALAKAGIKGSQSGTALNAMFARLQLAGTDFRKVGLAGAFKEVSKQIKSIKDPTARATAEFGLFGLEHAKSGLAMLDNIPVIDELSVSMRGTDAAAEQARLRMQTFSQQMKLTGIILDEKIIKLFEAARVGTNFAGEAIRNFIKGLDKSDIETFGIVLSGLGTIVAGLVKIFSGAFSIIMGVIKPVVALLKGAGSLLGKLVGAIATGNFSELKEVFSAEGLKKEFSLGGELFGVIGGSEQPAPVGVGGGSSTTDINMNINAPEGVVESVQSKTSGKNRANVGLNMATG